MTTMSKKEKSRNSRNAMLDKHLLPITSVSTNTLLPIYINIHTYYDLDQRSNNETKNNNFMRHNSQQTTRNKCISY